MPGCEAVEGLGKKEREGLGLSGGVVRMVFLAAWAMGEGFRPTDGGVEMPMWMKVDGEVGLLEVFL